MDNFWRILRSTSKYRWTYVGIFISSTMVALFWGGNIASLAPVIKVSLQEQPLSSWLDEEISHSEDRIAKLEIEINGLQQGIPRSDLEDVNADKARLLSKLRHDLKTEQRALRTSRWMEPYIRHFPRDPFQTVVLVIGALIVGTVFKGAFIFWNYMLVSYLEQGITFDLRRRFFHQCLRLDQSAFGEEGTNRILTQFHTDIGLITAGIKSLFGTALREPLKMVACLAIAAIISWRLLLFSLILTPITAYAIRKLGGSIKRANRRSLEEFTSLFGLLSEAFQGIETVQAFTLERSQRGKFFRMAKACLHKGMRIAFYNALTKPVTELLGICVIALAVLSGAYLTLKQETHIGPIRLLARPIELEWLVVFFGLLVGATEPARKLSDIFNSLQAAIAASDRLMPLLDRESAIASPRHPMPLPPKLEGIEFTEISFHYRPSQPVLDRVSLSIPPGETIAIVGPNGCGKTTLISMLPRFHDPIQGGVTIGGIDVRQFRPADLRQRIGMVTQRALLFDDTVYNNILQGRLDASAADVQRAARQARAEKFILEKLENGYETVIGAGGSNLSGGQRQRIALARAMLRDPDILILDEATSQIDLESEQLIHQALAQFSQNRTVIIITHRLATLELAHRVVVMNQGTVEDVGTHQELMRRCSLYQRLHEMQFKRTA